MRRLPFTPPALPSSPRLAARLWIVLAAGTALALAPSALAAGPTIVTFTPTSAPVGAHVTILGSGFDQSAVVRFRTGLGDVVAKRKVKSQTQIDAIVPFFPPNATHGPIRITTSGGTAQSPLEFALPVPSADTTLPLDKGVHAPVPVRVLDTVKGIGAPAGALPAGNTVSFAVAGVHGLPSTAAGFVLSVGIAETGGSDGVTLFPAGAAPPLVRQVIVAAGNASGTAVVAAGSGGKISLLNRTGKPVQATVDVVGWFALKSALHTSKRVRLLDTRTGLGNGGSTLPVAPGASVKVPILSRGGVPSTGVSAAIVTVAALSPTQTGGLTVAPAGTSLATQDVRFVKGGASAGLAFAAIGSGGAVSITNKSTGTVHVTLDVSGWLESGGNYTALKGGTQLDTSSGIGAPKAPLGPAKTLSFATTDSDGVPQAGVGAVVLSVTVSPGASAGKLTVWRAGTRRPGTPNVTFAAGSTNAGFVLVRPGTRGLVSVYNASKAAVNVQAKALGWVSPGLNEVDLANVVPLTFSAARFQTYNPAGQSVFTVSGTSYSNGAVVVFSPTASHPKGLIGIVRRRQVEGSKTILTTSAGTIADVIPIFSVSASADFPSLFGKPPPSGPEPALTAVPLAAASSQTGNKFFDFSCSGGSVNVVDLSTSFSASLGTFSLTGGPKAGFVRLTLSPSVNAHIGGTVLARGACQGTFTPVYISFPTVFYCIPVGFGCIPVWFDQTITASAIASLTAEAAMPFSVDFSAAGTLGAQVGKGGGLINTMAVTAGAEAPRFDWAVDGDVWLRAGYDAKAYSGLLEVQVGLGPFLHLDGPSGADWLRLAGGLRGDFAGSALWGLGHLGPFTGELPPGGWPLWTLPKPQRAPDPPVNVAATPGEAKAFLTWDPPAQQGTQPINSYSIQQSELTNGAWTSWANATTSTTTKATVTGLDNDHPYIFRVVAINGIGTGSEPSVPSAAVKPEPNLWTQISVGLSHACGVRENGAAYCWGDGSAGEIGDGALADHHLPTPVSGLSSGVTAVSAAGGFSCALRSGGAVCWGKNDRGQLGSTNDNEIPTPSAVPGLSSGVRAIAAGGQHACAIKHGRKLKNGILVAYEDVYCWGDDQYGQIGNGATSASPVAPATVLEVTNGSPSWLPADAVTAGARHTCAMIDHKAWCWGANAHGQLGDTTTTQRMTPVVVYGMDSGVTAISASADSAHTCGIRGARAYCWGDNGSGQLGTGSKIDDPKPAQVAFASPTLVARISAGGAFTCAASSDATYCWGDNSAGQLGTGTTLNQTTPVRVVRVGGAGGVSAGDGSACGVSGGSASHGYCWGFNADGQLGDDTTEGALVPVDLGEPLSSTAIVSLGDSFISGEGGRWAGNTDTSGVAKIDALGPKAYYDNALHTGEKIPWCHRSASAEIHIGVAGVDTLNLACSGAASSTVCSNPEGRFKPGIDTVDCGGGRVGQAQELHDFALDRNVTMIVLSIGGNDLGFADLVAGCVEDYVKLRYCRTDPDIASLVTPARLNAVRGKIVGAIQNIRRAMAHARHPANTYTILVQDYALPIPPNSGFRYPSAWWARLDPGGCGFNDKDADWAGGVVSSLRSVVMNAVTQANSLPGSGNDAVFLDLIRALAGHRLCESSDALIEDSGVAAWSWPGASDKLEWANQIRPTTAGANCVSYCLEESFHPNYWAQLALRNCVRQAYNAGRPRGGACTFAEPGLNSYGEPNMVLK